jgi:transcriptional regulator EpsA
MDSLPGLNPAELERLLLVIDAAIKVSRRHHFYLWVQGIFQSLLPHDVLVCVSTERDRRPLALDQFTSVPVADTVGSRLHAADGLCAQLTQRWLRHGGRPLVLDPDDMGESLPTPLLLELKAHGLGLSAVHGSPPHGATPAVAFVLLRNVGPRGDKLRYLLEILTPYLHAAWTRCQAADKPAAADPPGGRHPLTVREAEILHWVQQGESNATIAAHLGISALTVKNHVQNILKKLGVQNRAQAAARGIMWDITKPPA